MLHSPDLCRSFRYRKSSRLLAMVSPFSCFGFADVRKARIIIDRSQAIGWAMQEAQAGDTVVIAGMGERPHSPLDPEDALANDGELVRNALRGAVPKVPLRLAA